ncbi:outer membrane lipoprotein-sorting protein [Methylohalobius crimeensis]|uniref:outer membrane lipoprotein-sorting protein n=1 Tax=Methylohalobius crimeensis TaxID=244365 RepID=UPI001F393F00|nr:outer membrane lipoprotein-sorting protein [Methylohalobius crimeensis]
MPMRRKSIIKLSLWFVCLFWYPSVFALTPEERGLEIAREVERRDEGWRDFRVDLMMLLRNQRGETSKRYLRSFNLEGNDDGDKSLLIFDSPADVAGTKFLTFSHKQGDDDQWLYLPALKRVKRISAANKGGSFMGSEFSYEDMTAPVLEKYTYKYLRDDNYKGRSVFVTERYPKDENSLYSKQVIWTDQEHYIPWKIEYYNRRGDHLKSLTYHRYKHYLGKFWRPGRMLMINHQTGKATVLVWEDYRFHSSEIRVEMFNPAILPRLP